ncbi:Pet127-domain-containing protein [Aulographum hederae CBS 113979]|uniref:Pet127-domain-containing protein n=1 Tax=Aulographum hederae CBS 113979 TaxID=1176131 RepID=A0A6G1GJN0_9PEZI|nr:Pet127-domain-containing protein [Aulographum hederae CBS 113979]
MLARGGRTARTTAYFSSSVCPSCRLQEAPFQSRRPKDDRQTFATTSSTQLPRKPPTSISSEPDRRTAPKPKVAAPAPSPSLLSPGKATFRKTTWIDQEINSKSDGASQKRKGVVRSLKAAAKSPASRGSSQAPKQLGREDVIRIHRAVPDDGYDLTIVEPITGKLSGDRPDEPELGEASRTPKRVRKNGVLKIRRHRSSRTKPVVRKVIDRSPIPISLEQLAKIIEQSEVLPDNGTVRGKRGTLEKPKDTVPGVVSQTPKARAERGISKTGQQVSNKAQSTPRATAVQELAKSSKKSKVPADDGTLRPKKSVKKTAKQSGKTSALLGDDVVSLTGGNMELTPLSVEQPEVPRLAYGLDRVLFNPGVYLLQDPRSRLYNFDPYLQKIMPVEEFEFNLLNAYITSSKDNTLNAVATEHKKKYAGSTSSMTDVLKHFHYLLSAWREINTDMLSKGFPVLSKSFTEIQKAPVAVFLRWKNGSYAVDADKQFDSSNILAMLGKSMEKLLTLPKEEYERYRRSSPQTSREQLEKRPESYHYTTFGDFLMRSQLDAYDARLPGSGMFDLKTRAVVSIRADVRSYERGMGYELREQQGKWESYEREYYDLIRATMLKYSLQVRMGRMDGIFAAFHNIERIFGFQYITLQDMDRALHGQLDTTLGDQEFKISLSLLNAVFDRATAAFPEQTIRFHFSTNRHAPFMYVFAEPMSEEEADEIQNTNREEVENFERSILGLNKGGNVRPNTAWKDLRALVDRQVRHDQHPQIESMSLDDPKRHSATFGSQILDLRVAVDAFVQRDRELNAILDNKLQNPQPDESESSEDESLRHEARGIVDGAMACRADLNRLQSSHYANEREQFKDFIDYVDFHVNRILSSYSSLRDAEGVASEPSTADGADETGTTTVVTGNPEDSQENEEIGTTVVDTTATEIEAADGQNGSDRLLDKKSTRNTKASSKGNARQLLGMTVTIRNNVNGKYVARPINLTKDDSWTVEYSICEIEDKMARTTYETARRQRRKQLSEDRDDTALDWYRRRLVQLTQGGRKWRLKQDEIDRKAGTVLFKSSEHSPGGKEAELVPVASETASSQDGSDEAVEVGDYMNWLYAQNAK